MHVCECVCARFLRPSRGGKFSRAIIRPQITALHSQKSPLLGPHQQHNEDFTAKNQTHPLWKNVETSNSLLRISGNTEDVHQKQLFCGQVFKWWAKKKKKHGRQTDLFVSSIASSHKAVMICKCRHFLVKQIILDFHPCRYHRLSGALKLSLPIVGRVNISSHTNDTARNTEKPEKRKQHCLEWRATAPSK